MKILNVVESSFRTLVEEQDDTILWLVQTLNIAGAETSVLLSGNAVYYAFLKSRSPALSIGTWTQKTPANISRDIAALINSGTGIYVLIGDIVERGLDSRQMNSGITVISNKDVPELYEQADQVWQW